MATSYRADNVGSFLRPARVLEARAAYNEGQMERERLREIEDSAILEVLEMQRQVGVDVFTDGEFRRDSFLTGLSQWLEGFSPNTESFLREWHGPDGGMLPTTVRVVNAKLRHRRFTAEEVAFMKEHSPGPIKITMPSATMIGFGAFKQGLTERHYATPAELLRELAGIINNEVRAVIEDGVHYIQIDAPNYPMRYCAENSRQLLQAQGLDFDQDLDDAIAADNACLEGAKREGVTLGFHVCRGNNRSRWQVEGGYEPIAEKLFGSLDVDAFLLEYDTDRAGGFEPLRFVPPGKTVVLGLVTTKEGRMEPQDLLLRRIEEASKYVALDDLALSPQCGFASVSAGNLVSFDDQRRKLELVVETARKVWG